MSYIPEKVTVVYKKAETLSSRWENSNEIIGESLEVYPAFVVPSDKPDSIQTAKEWAGKGFESFELDNSPVYKIRIVGLSHRGNGGRAYKVLWYGNNYVDLREDVLLDCFANCDIRQGGYIDGHFIWARIGSQMKLVRVDSKLHKTLINDTEKRSLKCIPVKDLESGYTYKNKYGNQFLYLGKVDTYSADKNFKLRIDTNNLLVMVTGTAGSLKENLKKKSTYYFNIQKTLKVIERKNDTVEIPDDLLEKLREIALVEYRKVLSGLDNNYGDYYHYTPGHWRSKEYQVKQLAPLCHAVWKGEQLNRLPNFSGDYAE